MSLITIQSISPISHQFSIVYQGQEHNIIIPGINSLGVGYIGEPTVKIEIDSFIYDEILKKYAGNPILSYYSIPKIKEEVQEESGEK